MALPRHKSIFDEEHPVASTEATFAYPDAYRNVIGIAMKNADPNGKRTVMMRGAILCPDPDDEEEPLPNELDSENESVINRVIDFARDLKKWITENTFHTQDEDNGMIYAHGDKPLADLNPPTRFKVLTMESGNAFRVTGEIQERKINWKRPIVQGMALHHYYIQIKVNGQECVPVVMGQNWR